MELLFLVPVAAIGGVTAVVLTWIDKVFDNKRRTLEFELRLQQERTELRESRIVEIERDNEKLRKEIDWYRRLVETQSGESPPAELLPGQPASRTIGAPRQN